MPHASPTTGANRAAHRKSSPPRVASMTRVRRLGFAIAMFCTMCATLFATTSTLLVYADDQSDNGADALQLHVQPPHRDLEEPLDDADAQSPYYDGTPTQEEESEREENTEQVSEEPAVTNEIPEPPEPPKPTPSPEATTRATSTRLRREGSQGTGSESPTVDTENPAFNKASGLRIRHEKFDNALSRQRGIIIALHDRIVPLGLSLIKDLRCLGNVELIQVYHCFPNELSPESRELLVMNETRLEIVDVCSHYMDTKVFTTNSATKFRNWWVKPLALYHTNVREPIVLDADVVPMQDPAVLRGLPGYERTGTTFFYDRVIGCKLYFNADFRGHFGVQLLRRWIETFDYASFNLTGPAPSTHLLNSFAYSRQTCHEMDSSMVAIDKTRAGKAMDVLWLLITKMRFEYDFSWGDKEAFWLAYEFAHVDYFFSPWGVSAVSSSANRDVEEHPETLCGSIAHFLPVERETPELLYVNGKALVEPFPDGAQASRHTNINQLFNVQPTHVTPRQVRKEKAFSQKKFFDECLVGLGSTPLPPEFQWHLLRRRTFYFGIRAGVYAPLSQCNMF